jgi:hypothetical protein
MSRLVDLWYVNATALVDTRHSPLAGDNFGFPASKRSCKQRGVHARLSRAMQHGGGGEWPW